MENEENGMAVAPDLEHRQELAFIQVKLDRAFDAYRRAAKVDPATPGALELLERCLPDFVDKDALRALLESQEEARRAVQRASESLKALGIICPQ